MICADEFNMADEAFALSPISARASLPGEQDYEAIREAFMETSRGRWFLGEYARRNRNADTSMVLDAVARIEESLAARRPPVPESGLAEALAAIGRAVEEARAAASAALDGLALEENLARARKGARVVTEIAWRLREIGADGRICDLIDSQVSAIAGACGQISPSGPRTALNAAFDLIEARIEQFGDSDSAAAQAMEEAMPSPSPAKDTDVATSMPAAAVDVTPEVVAARADVADISVETADMPAAAPDATPEVVAVRADVADVLVETADTPAAAVDVTPEVVAVRADVADASVETADMPAAALDVIPEAGDENPHATDAYDEALLDMVALEMAAPDASDTDDSFDTGGHEIHVSEPPPAGPEFVAERPEPSVAPEPPPAIQPANQPSLEVSLGSTLLANGIVRRPHRAGPDPLAPIRRMSQAEKIAFFS